MKYLASWLGGSICQIFHLDLCMNIVLGFISYFSLFLDSFSGLQFYTLME